MISNRYAIGNENNESENTRVLRRIMYKDKLKRKKMDDYTNALNIQSVKRIVNQKIQEY